MKRILIIGSIVSVGLLASAVVGRSQTTHKIISTPDTVLWGYYDAASKPVMTVQSGDVIEFDTNPVPALSDPAWTKVARGQGNHILLGPIYVNGATNGDVLEIKIEELKVAADFGTNSIRPEYGTLPDDFPYSVPGQIPIDRNRNVGLFAPGIEVSLHPFLGSMGVAPAPTSGRISSRPPGYHGGNLDNKELVVGSSLFLPVQVNGALFSFGDSHSAQGDGEVDGLALETMLAGKLRLIVHKGERLKWPRAETPTHYIAMGLNPSLDEAMKIAVRETIDFLVKTKGLSPENAYRLASIAVDYHVTQSVDLTKGVHAMIPKSIFK